MNKEEFLGGMSKFTDKRVDNGRINT